MYLDAAKARLAEATARVHLADRVKPCSAREVTALELRFGMPLPAAYREFLLWMGHGAGHLLQGSDCFYSAVPLNDGAWELLHENKIALPLRDDAFVFYMHQGYQFMFFLVSDGPNPPVYFFGEGAYDPAEGAKTPTGFPRLYARFSDFLQAEIATHEAILAERARLKGKLAQKRRGLAESACLSQKFGEDD